VTAGGKCEMDKSVGFIFVTSDTEKNLVIHADNLIQCAYFIAFLSTATVTGCYDGCNLSV
jgi:hypothetical protein